GGGGAKRLPGPGGGGDGGAAAVCGQTGDQTGQKSKQRRSPRRGWRDRHRLTLHGSVTVMDLTIHASFLPHEDPEASLAFWRDSLGFEVRNDVGYGGVRWVTVGPAGPPATSLCLGRPAPAGGGGPEEERRTIVEMMAKGTYAGINLATKELDGVFARLVASGAEVGQDPTEQPDGVRHCAVRDPAGNLIRIQQLR